MKHCGDLVGYALAERVRKLESDKIWLMKELSESSKYKARTPKEQIEVLKSIDDINDRIDKINKEKAGIVKGTHRLTEIRNYGRFKGFFCHSCNRSNF